MKWKWLPITIINLIVSITLLAQGTILNQTFQMMPQIGVLVQNVNGTQNKVDAIGIVLGSKYARMAAFQAQTWSGPSTNIDAYERVRDAGMGSHFVLDVGYCASLTGCSPEPWITASTGFNLNDLATAVDQILTKYPLIRVLVLDNEEINRALAYHFAGTVHEYMDIAKKVLPICKAHNVKLVNGGFGQFDAINGYTFRYIKTYHGQALADQFANYVFNGGTSNIEYQAANDLNCSSSGCSTRNVRILEVDTVVSWDGWDMLNFHMYNPILNSGGNPDPPLGASQIEIWKWYVEAFRKGNPRHLRPAVCNETGQRGTEDAPMVTNMLDMAWYLQMPIYDWWSGHGNELDSRPLTTDAGTLVGHPNGQAYETWSDRYEGTPPH